MSIQEHNGGKRIGKSKKYPADDFQDDGVVHGNGVNPETIQSYVGRIENLYGEIGKVKSAMMNDCKILHTDIKQVYIEAKKEGLNKKSLSALIKERGLLAKAAECSENLEADEADLFTMMKDALGDFAGLPLGQAALDRVR